MSVRPPLPGPLVSDQWLADHLAADHLGAGRLVVLDASVANFTRPDGKTGYLSGHELYLLDGHIPGAVFADVIDELSDPEGSYPFTRPDAERFAAAIGALGIDNDTTVVVYDTAVGQWAARVWWLFRAFGYDEVAVLDGGLTSWRAADRDLDLGHVEPEPRDFTATERAGLWADKQFVEGVLRGEHDAALVCAAPPHEFERRHIPGSTSAPAARLVERERRTYLDRDALAGVFAPALGSSRIVTYCGGGIAASSAAFALTLLGQDAVAVYDGSLNEWAADPEAALVTSAG
ncbi:MAG: rhodanese-like domain-containing protein [Pseudolysinimonas sp.]